MQKLAKDIYVESGFPGVTVGAIITADGIICIDAPTHPADARRWRLKLAQLSPKPVRFTINLDHHRDRILGTQWLEAPVIAHEHTSERIRQLPEVFKGGVSEAGADADLAADLIGARFVPPQLTFGDRMVVAHGGRELHLTHHPGPTPGAVWVEIPAEGVVFVGDAVTNDVPPVMAEANPAAWLEALGLLQKKKYPARVVVPGRGAVTDKAGVKVMEDFLRALRRKVDALIRSKRTRSEVGQVAPDFLDYFTVPGALRDHYTRRIRAGLERVYDLQLMAQHRS
jgi:glyoxylase-like metal-dependent hydrolase (beta-lactamase superfamily II)